MRSAPRETSPAWLEIFEGFASTGVNAPGTMFLTSGPRSVDLSVIPFLKSIKGKGVSVPGEVRIAALSSQGVQPQLAFPLNYRFKCSCNESLKCSSGRLATLWSASS
jgi:hypothetical protein